MNDKMLVLSRQRDESIMIGDDVEVAVVDIRADKVRLGIYAPPRLSVHRKEVYEAIKRENEAALYVRPRPFARRPDPFADFRAEQLQEARQSSNAVQLRSATERDLSYISEIYNYYVEKSTCTYQEEPESLEDRHRWFARHGAEHPINVAAIDGTVVGWGSLSPYHSRSAYRFTVENSVYVHHEFHRRGIGAMLLQDLIDRARAIGHHSIVALIDANQSGSIALHARFGFAQVGHLKQVGFKFGRWLDVIYMQLLLDARPGS